MLSHRIRPVLPPLAPHVEHLWIVRGHLPARWRNMILPDGAMELIINLGDPQGEKLIHDFEQIKGDGKSSIFVAKVTPQDHESWENEIFSRNGNELKQVVKVRYEKAN